MKATTSPEKADKGFPAILYLRVMILYLDLVNTRLCINIKNIYTM